MLSIVTTPEGRGLKIQHVSPMVCLTAELGREITRMAARARWAKAKKT